MSEDTGLTRLQQQSIEYRKKIHRSIQKHWREEEKKWPEKGKDNCNAFCVTHKHKEENFMETKYDTAQELLNHQKLITKWGVY